MKGAEAPAGSYTFTIAKKPASGRTPDSDVLPTPATATATVTAIAADADPAEATADAEFGAITYYEAGTYDHGERA